MQLTLGPSRALRGDGNVQDTRYPGGRCHRFRGLIIAGTHAERARFQDAIPGLFCTAQTALALAEHLGNLLRVKTGFHLTRHTIRTVNGAEHFCPAPWEWLEGDPGAELNNARTARA